MEAVTTPKKEASAKPKISYNEIVRNMVEDKNAVFAYFRGEITIHDLNARGIKLG